MPHRFLHPVDRAVEGGVGDDAQRARERGVPGAAEGGGLRVPAQAVGGVAGAADRGAGIGNGRGRGERADEMLLPVDAPLPAGDEHRRGPEIMFRDLVEAEQIVAVERAVGPARAAGQAVVGMRRHLRQSPVRIVVEGPAPGAFVGGACRGARGGGRIGRSFSGWFVHARGP